MTDRVVGALYETTMFPEADEVERMLAVIEEELDERNHRQHVRRSRNRRLAWGGGGLAVFAATALVVTGALNPLVSIIAPDGAGRVYLQIDCFGANGSQQNPAVDTDRNDDAAMRAKREDPAGVCTAMAQQAAFQRQLIEIEQRPDVAAAGAAVVYATDGSVWQFEKGGGTGPEGSDGWLAQGGPVPWAEIGESAAPTSYPLQKVPADAVILHDFVLKLPAPQPQAVCVKNDVEFDVYVLRPGQTAGALCSAHGLVAQN